MLAAFLCVIVAFVASGAFRNMHEAAEHARGHVHSSDDADASHAAMVVDDHDHDLPAESDQSSHQEDRDHCATCVTLASLGKMPTAPPMVAVPPFVLLLADALTSPASSTPLVSSCLNAAVSERGPPLV